MTGQRKELTENSIQKTRSLELQTPFTHSHFVVLWQHYVHALPELSVKGSERQTFQNPAQTQLGSDIYS
jgi:hypothetical protein